MFIFQAVNTYYNYQHHGSYPKAKTNLSVLSVN